MGVVQDGKTYLRGSCGMQWCAKPNVDATYALLSLIVPYRSYPHALVLPSLKKVELGTF